MSFEQVPSLPVLYNCYIPWLTALAAPLEDQGSISSTNVVWFTAVSISSFKETNALVIVEFWNSKMIE